MQSDNRVTALPKNIGISPLICGMWLAILAAPVMGQPLVSSDPAWQMVAKIDCTAQPPDSVVGQSQVVHWESGDYREAGPRVGDRFVYAFKLSHPDRLVRVSVRYPDNQMRTAGVSAWGPPQEVLGSGYMTGEDIPLSQQMVERQYVFFSPNQNAAIVFSTEAAKQPVAVASLVIEEASAHLPPAPTAAISAINHRRMGMTWEDPVLARCFGGPESVDVVDFDVVVQRCVMYAKWAGLSEINYPAYWYTGPMFDSRSAPSKSIENRKHPPDALVRLARQCEAGDIAYVPVLNVFKLRPLLDHMLSEEEVIAGKPCINTVGADGRIVTWTNAQLWRDCVSTPLNPIVQDACRALAVEVATQCAPYRSFKGVDLAMWPGSILKPGSSIAGDSAMSFDDYSVDAFCEEAHLTPPGKLGEKDRFAQRAKWLKEDTGRWNAWLKWRAARMTQFYSSLADELATIKPGIRLGICVFLAYGRPENEGIDINQQIYASGIDLDALSKNPNIAIKRYGHQMLPRWRLRSGMPRPKNLNIENTAGFQAPFAHRPGMGFILHQQYFETRVDINGDELRLPAPYVSEKTTIAENAHLRVTEPLPSGRDYLRFFAGALRNYDPFSMTVGGYVLGTQGTEPELREMATAFSALPAVQFEDVLVADEAVVRRAQSEGRTWVYAVNVTAVPQMVRISLKDGNAANAVTGLPVAAVGGQVSIQLRPYELTSLVGPASLNVAAAEVEVPGRR